MSQKNICWMYWQRKPYHIIIWLMAYHGKQKLKLSIRVNWQPE